MASPRNTKPKAVGVPEPESSGQEPADTRQFVTFQIDGELFAVPLAEVQEIIRMPELVQLPLSPPSLDGLANLRGAVLPISNLRKIFQVEVAPYDDATRVVIINRGQAIGFVVDRMSSVITAEPDQIERVETIQTTVRTDLLSGVIKSDAGMVMILDPGALFAVEAGSGRKKQGRERSAEAETREGGRETLDEIQLVSFEAAGQEYALAIERVQEIVQVPPNISRIPKAESHVIGVMTLRNRLLPLVSLRRMFALEHAEIGEHNRIVVVSLEDGVPGSEPVSVGVVMDTVKEVLRVSKSLVDPVPPLLANSNQSGELQGICRLSEGKRLVSILSAEKLFQHSSFKEAAAMAETSEEDQIVQTARQSGGNDDEEQFVVFRLANEEYGVPIDSVQEIVRVPDELTRMPKTGDTIEGVVNLRGTVLPVIDQRRRFGLPEVKRNDRQRIMVFTLNGVRTGFIVDSVSEVLKISRSVIEAAPDLSADQARLIGRVANIHAAKRMVLLLDVTQLLGGAELAELAQAAE